MELANGIPPQKKIIRCTLYYFGAPYTTHAQLLQGHRSNFALNLISLRTVPTRKLEA